MQTNYAGMLAEEQVTNLQSNTNNTHLPSGYIGLGGTGMTLLPIVMGNGGTALLIDGASEPHIIPQAEARFKIVNLPRQQYRDYIPLVQEMGNIFHPDLVQQLQFAVGGDDRGGSAKRAYGRVAVMHEQSIKRLEEQADAMVAQLRALRHGRMTDTVMHYLSSTSGGMGSPILLDARRQLNNALFANQALNVNNVHWLLGLQAFEVIKNRRARLYNHVATTLEMVENIKKLEPDETHVYDMVMMIDLPPTSDEIRYRNMRQILRLTNPAVWDQFYDLLINSMNNAAPEEEWLKTFIHLHGGPLGQSVLLGEVLAVVAQKLAQSVKTAPSSEVVTIKIEPKLNYTEGKGLGNEAIFQLLKDGNLKGLLDLCDLKEVSASLEAQFSLAGSPITLEGLMTLPSMITSTEMGVRIRTLRAVAEDLARIHMDAVAIRDRASKELSNQGDSSMARLTKLADAFSTKTRKGLLGWAFGEMWDGFKTEVMKSPAAAGAEVRNLLRKIADARKDLARADAIIALLENPDHPEQSLIGMVKAGIQTLASSTATSSRTLTALAGTSIVSPGAVSLVNDGLVALVDDLLRRGRTIEEIHAELWAMLKRQPVKLEQISGLLGCRPDKHDVAVTLARMYNDAQGKALYWTTPVLQPWLRVILTPTMDHALHVEIQRELETVAPGLNLWVDDDGDGESVGFAFAIAHGVQQKAEVISPVWKDVVTKLNADSKEKSARTFVDRPFEI